MDRAELYDVMAARKDKPKDYEPYTGDNGRVNKCANIMRAGKIRTGGTLLDVGGGIGDLGYAVRDLFDVRYTLDITLKSLGPAQAKGNKVLCRDVDHQGFKGIEDDSVDVVTALDAIAAAINAKPSA